jgi:hypothetical protein
MGIPSEVSDVNLDIYIDSALNRYSQIRERIALTQISAVKDTQLYALPDTFLDVVECHYTPTGIASQLSFWLETPAWWRLSTGDIYEFDQPSLGAVWMAKYRSLLETFEGSWEVQERDDTLYLRLLPPPRQDQTLPVLGRIKRSTSQVLDKDLEIFALCVQVVAFNALAGGVGSAMQFTDTGMTINLGPGAQHYAERAEAAEQRLIALAGVSTVVRRG